ncbi:MAG TPA: recombination mediator RecR [Synergistaceae bacterium]|nr:recombination mediator RecR [Synergistaceae bacterium]HPJ25226.1 recombination mediator RecR [Synergistaceae bacterium]
MAVPSLIERAIQLFSQFPGIGEKSGRRMAFHLLQQPEAFSRSLAEVLVALRRDLHFCKRCNGLAEGDLCPVCMDPFRDTSILCVVESAEDMLCIEESGAYRGIYYVLGGYESPLEDRSIPEKSLEKLLRRLQEEPEIREVVLATNPRVEGELTSYRVCEYLRAHKCDCRITRLSYGLPVGGAIGYADRVTLHAALESRRDLKDEDL